MSELTETCPNQDVINDKKLTKIDRFLSLWTNYCQFGHFLLTFYHFGQFSINFLSFIMC